MIAERTLREILREHYAGRRVLVTGHNGFVGSWLTSLLEHAGATVHGLSLPAEPRALGTQLAFDGRVDSNEVDVRDLTAVSRVVGDFNPEIVFHLAAQALVGRSFAEPLETIETNVLGTANLLQVIRESSVRACVVVTSDKCYEESELAHLESDPLGGNDPYSASKAAAELVVQAFRQSFLAERGPAVATARAGNILGGGDRGVARIVPDFVRAIEAGTPIVLRCPEAVRPWQHVLDAVAGYLRLGAALLEEPAEYASAWNFGPDAATGVSVGELVEMLRATWTNAAATTLARPIVAHTPAPERGYLMLDSRKSRTRLHWHPVLDLDSTIEWTINWHAAEHEASRTELVNFHNGQIDRFLILDGHCVRARARGLEAVSVRVARIDAVVSA